MRTPISTQKNCFRGGVMAALAVTVALLVVGACTANVGGPGANPPDQNGGAGNGSGAGTSGGSSGSGSVSGSGGSTGVTGTGGDTVNPGSGGGPLTGTGGGSTGGAGAGGAPVESGGLMPFLRLTHREYSNTMAELLGDASNIGSTFESDTDGLAGFVAANNVATENARQYMAASEKLAPAALASGKLMLPCTNPADAPAETTCVTQFLSTFGARAYRRPLVKGESDDLLALFRTGRALGFTFVESVTRVVETMLQSPNLLYHWEIGDQALVRDPSNSALVALTPHQLASRLSYFLGESPPDAALTTAATSGALSTPEGLRTQAIRLLQDERRARKAMFNFHQQWLHMQRLKEAASADVALLLGQEVEAFVSSVMVTGDGTLKTLLTAPYTFANAVSAKEYNLTATGTAFSKIELNPAQRQGILMQVPFLRANGGEAPPVHRGVTVYRQVLCGVVPPPDAAVGPPLPDPNSTTRELFDKIGQNACARGCHALFHPWGFAFENFDTLGAYRTMENGKPIDASGLPQANGTVGGRTSQQTIAFKNGTELVNALADSPEVSNCVSKQWARYMLGRMETDADLASITAAYQAAAYQADRTTARPFSVRDFLVNIVTTKTFRFRQRAPGEVL